MSGDTTLTATKREVVGKKVRQLRAEGQTPAVIHNHGGDSLHISIPEVELRKVYASSGKHHPVEVTIDGKKHTTLIKEVMYKPATSIVYHTVFQAIKANEKATAQIPLHLSEDIPAEKLSLQVIKKIESIEVEALPKDLVDVIEVDANILQNVGDKITVADLKVPSTITIKTEPDQVIATVEMPRDQIAEANASAEETAAQVEATEAEQEQASTEEE